MDEEIKKMLEGLPEDKTKAILDEIAKNQSIAKDVISQRDALKSKLKEIETAKEKEEEERLTKQSEFKTLAEERQKKLEELTKELEEAKPYKEKYTAVEAERREELINRLPDGEHKELAKDLPMDKLKKYVEINGKETSSTHTSRGGGRGFDVNKMTLDDFNALESKDKESLKKSNPAIYNKMLNERLGKR